MIKKTKRNRKVKRLKRMDVGASKKKPPFIESDLVPTVVFSEYSITDEPIEHPSIKRLPKMVKDEIETLANLIQSDPRKAISRLEELIGEYPLVPHFGGYLAVAHSTLSNGEEKAYELVIENYNKFPDYLFAKLHYAELCINRNEFNKIPIIFDNKFTLTSLYPDRNTFHTTEVINFNGVIGFYFAEVQTSLPPGI